jgi:hypothetical protein
MRSQSWWTDAETFICTLVSDRLDGLAASKVAFTTHCPFGRDFIERCHKFDVRCFPYVTFYLGSDNPLWNTTYVNTYEGIDFSKHHFYEIDANGNPRSANYEHDGVGIVLNPCLITCPNVLEYQHKMVQWVEYIMERGADGVFVDNLITRQPCFGARRGIHSHIFPDPATPNDATAQNQAFGSLLHHVREVVRKHKPDGRVLGNSGDPLNLPMEFQQHLDSDALEGYICSNNGQRVADWHGMTWDEAGRNLQPYLARKKQILVFSDIGTEQTGLTASQVAENAFLCFASARLAGFIWTCNIPTSTILRNLCALRLGEALTEELTDPASGVNYRVFERGLVAVNADAVNDKILTAQPPIIGNIFVDVFAGTSTSVLAIPKYSGRVFLFSASVDFGVGILTP